MQIKKTILTSLLVCAVGALCLSASAWKADKVVYANADPDKYYVECDVNNCVTTVYEKGESGKYDKIVRQMICTPGAKSTPTPTGSFTFNDTRRRFGYFSKYNCYAQYWIHVQGGIYFHSILYNRPVEGNFTRTSYNQLGKPGSHGCIRMLVEDVRWMYYNIPGGTKGKIVSKAKDEALRQSLLPKVSARDYKPEADRYEKSNRTQPRALLAENAQIELRDKTIKTLGKGSVVSVLSSGGEACRVQVDGVNGLVATKALEFMPNGYEDAKIVYRVNSDCNAYTDSSVESEVLDVLRSGAEVNITGESGNYYEIDLEGDKAYIVKYKVDGFRRTTAERAIWITSQDEDSVEEIPENADADVPDEPEEITEEPVN